MATDYSTADGQKQLMRESVGQPTEFRIGISSGFKEGQILEPRCVSQQHSSNRVTFICDGKPECGLAVIRVRHRDGIAAEWLARDFQLVNLDE